MDRPAPDRVAEALFGTTRRRLLALFFGRPDESFYGRQIVRESGAGAGAVHRELRRLTDAGLIVRTPAGNQVHFSANRESPVFNELRGLLAKTAGVADVVRTALKRFAERDAVRGAFIYGSVATGEQSVRSDVDLMVIGDISMTDLVAALRPVEERLGREVNATLYDLREFRRKVKVRDHFVARILQQPKIMVIGATRDLAKLAGKPLAG